MINVIDTLNNANKSLLERLPGNGVVDGQHLLANDLEGLLASVLRQDIRDTMAQIARISDRVLSIGSEEDIAGYLDAIRDPLASIGKKQAALSLPEEIFFIWIGAIDDCALEYVDFWEKSNPKETITVWYDSRFLLAGKIRGIVYRLFSLAGQPASEIISCQNDIFAHLSRQMDHGKTFDTALIEYIAEIDSTQAEQLSNDRALISERLGMLSARYNFKDVADVAADIFLSPELAFYYQAEIALRYNLAAASDILRLSLLYRYGGTYIDVDTLPALDHIFQSTNTTYPEDALSKRTVEILKSESVLMRLRNDGALHSIQAGSFLPEREAELQDLAEAVDSMYPGISASIAADIKQTATCDIFQPREQKPLYRDTMLISSSNIDGAEFNNNILAAAPGSRMIRIILKEIIRRYQYIEKHGFFMAQGELSHRDKDHYLYRLNRYRLDTLDDEDNVTLYLTGPSLILELVLGVAYDVLRLSYEISPVAVSYALLAPELGVDYSSQTMYTMEHFDSCWM